MLKGLDVGGTLCQGRSRFKNFPNVLVFSANLASLILGTHHHSLVIQLHQLALVNHFSDYGLVFGRHGYLDDWNERRHMEELESLRNGFSSLVRGLRKSSVQRTPQNRKFWTSTSLRTNIPQCVAHLKPIHQQRNMEEGSTL